MACVDVPIGVVTEPTVRASVVALVDLVLRHTRIC